ncbi:MAG: endo-1,4-beta-xylanase [Candidatus Eisenbacteria bacterium]
MAWAAGSFASCPDNSGPEPTPPGQDWESIEQLVDPITTPVLTGDELEAGQVALTFDDGPDPVTTLAILEILEAHGVRATFFQIGQHAEAYPEITEEIARRGHALGSHSWDHTDLAQLSLSDAVANLERGHAAVEEAAGVGAYLPFFRFPHLSSNDDLLEAAQRRGLVVFQANIINQDWMTQDVDELLDNALDAVEATGSGIVLFHEYQPQTVEMLDPFLDEIEARGYQTVVFQPRPSLASRARAHGIRIGTTLWFLDEATNAPYRETALREFNLYTLPAFFRIVQPERGRFDFTIPDDVADAALVPATFFVHSPVDCDLLPDWIEGADLSADELEQILIEHVSTVVEHYEAVYPGRILGYNIINEPFSYRGDACPWNRIGLESSDDELAYVAIALTAAREAGPDALLFINDFHIEGLGDRSDDMYELASELVADAVPLGGVGLQSHFMVDSDAYFGPMPAFEEITQNMARLNALGLVTIISEADFSIYNADLSAVTLEHQAQRFSDLMHVCLMAASCPAFLTWGVGDADSWIPETFEGWGSALLFDHQYQPKPAYHALMEELAR